MYTYPNGVAVATREFSRLFSSQPHSQTHSHAFNSSFAVAGLRVCMFKCVCVCMWRTAESNKQVCKSRATEPRLLTFGAKIRFMKAPGSLGSTNTRAL